MIQVDFPNPASIQETDLQELGHLQPGFNSSTLPFFQSIIFYPGHHIFYKLRIWYQGIYLRNETEHKEKKNI